MNLNQRSHKRMHLELDSLMRLGILNENQVTQLKERYPTTEWDFMALVRAFTVLGALTAAAGLIVLIREYLNWWLVSEGSLALFAMGAFFLGRGLRARSGGAVVGETMELLGGMAVQGLITVVATHYSMDSKNLPSLLGWQTMVLAVLAYVLANRLVLWYACINFFFWFGAETGYISGWGCYWLGMTYPVRFLCAGLGTLLLSWLHAKVVRGRWAIFSRVYAHFGLLVIHLALWFLSLFGYYEDHKTRWTDLEGERLLFSLLWAAVAGGCLFAGARYSIRLLRGYGLTFFIINLYTFYFQFVAAKTSDAWFFLHLLLVGGSLLKLGFYFESRRRKDKAQN